MATHIFLEFSPRIPGEMESNVTTVIFFQRGWFNHQLELNQKYWTWRHRRNLSTDLYGRVQEIVRKQGLFEVRTVAIVANKGRHPPKNTHDMGVSYNGGTQQPWVLGVPPFTETPTWNLKIIPPKGKGENIDPKPPINMGSMLVFRGVGRDPQT